MSCYIRRIAKSMPKNLATEWLATIYCFVYIFFRYADIPSTPGHHRIWQTHRIWRADAVGAISGRI
jgi:hypothetical protein